MKLDDVVGIAKSQEADPDRLPQRLLLDEIADSGALRVAVLLTGGERRSVAQNPPKDSSNKASVPCKTWFPEGKSGLRPSSHWVPATGSTLDGSLRISNES
eukprot:scaffold991_cov227-Pinguiococcus_pyrenoidosus.AAC.3